MESDKDNTPNTAASEDNADSSSEPTIEQAPTDALSRTPDDLEEEQKNSEAAKPQKTDEPLAGKKISPFKRFLKRVNIYFLLFMLVLVVTGIIMIVMYLNSQKTPPTPNVASQELTEDALRQLANTDASVGNTSQTLNIQGNAVIEGQSLMRGNLNVAGNLQTGGSIQGPSLTISGSSNLGEAQINSLQVASNVAIQGETTMRNLSVAGTSTFSGAITASQLTVSQLTISGNGVLQVPNHLSFTGPTPSRSILSAALGGGGTASINGSDTSGTININTGNNPQAGCMVRIGFNRAFGGQPRVLISPIGAAAGRTDYYVDRDNGGFSLCASTPAPANSAMAFDYFVTGSGG